MLEIPYHLTRKWIPCAVTILFVQMMLIDTKYSINEGRTIGNMVLKSSDRLLLISNSGKLSMKAMTDKLIICKNVVVRKVTKTEHYNFLF